MANDWRKNEQARIKRLLDVDKERAAIVSRNADNPERMERALDALEPRERRYSFRRSSKLLDGVDEIAFDRIETAFMALCQDVWVKPASFERRSKAAPPDWPMRVQEAVADYKRWVRECRHQGIRHQVATELAVEDFSLRDCAIRCGMHHNTAARHLRLGLDLYADVAGLQTARVRNTLDPRATTG